MPMSLAMVMTIDVEPVHERGAEQLGWELEKLLAMTLQAMASTEDEINRQMGEEFPE